MIAYKFRPGKGTRDNEGMDVFERDIALLSRDMIYVPTVAQLNDPAEALVDESMLKIQLRLIKRIFARGDIKPLEDGLYGLRNKIRTSGIYSMSKRIDNELMWAYYASGHTGYAIIFDLEILAKSFNWMRWGGMYEFDVNYSSKLPRFDITKIDKLKIEEVLTCLAGTKSRAWEHEAEHRLVFDEGGRCIKLDYRAIKGFVFGCRMKEDEIDYVMKAFTGRDLAYYKVELKEDSYKLSVKRMEDRFPNNDKYSPNKVEYDVEELLEGDKYVGGVGYEYRALVEDALRDVSCEPFVTGISHIVVTDEKKYPHIFVWTKVNQDGCYKPIRAFEYDIIDGVLVKIEPESGSS